MKDKTEPVTETDRLGYIFLNFKTQSEKS